MIRLRTLGSLDLRSPDGEELRGLLAQPKRAALLVYLALATPRGTHRRDKVVALFWPELDDEHARNALSQAVRFLRRSIGETVLVSRNGDELSVDIGQLWCDAIAFEEALDAGRALEAVDLYRGDLLEGLHVANAPDFERWLDSERARLRQRHLGALEGLAQAREAAGDFRESTLWWRRLAATDPYSSRVTLRLMQSLVKAGDPAEAMRHARAHEVLLREDLGVQPDPEIAALVRRLQSTVAEAPVPAPAPAVMAPAVHVAASRPGYDRRRRRQLGVVAASILLIAGVGAAVIASRGALARAARPAAADSSERERYLMKHYLRGRDQEISRSFSGLMAAKEAYQRMVERDSSFALGYAGLSTAYYLIADYDYAPVRPALDSARMLALRAVRLDSMRSQARTALAVAFASDREFGPAEREFKQAIELDSTDAHAHFWYSVLLVALGRGHEALEEAKLAATLDPLAPRGVFAMERYARFLITGQREELRVRAAQRKFGVLKHEPSEPFAIAAAALDLAVERNCANAGSEIERAQRLVPEGNRRMLELVAAVRWECGDRPAARAIVLGMELRPDADDYGYRIAIPLTRFGETDSAFAWLRRHRWTLGQLSGLSADFRFDPLRADPRYHSLLRHLGLRPVIRSDTALPADPRAEQNRR